ncbi:hypothetical protein GCM10007968_23920 [Sporolactobacillus putidus]|uniref:Uncharacterized protein n=1 Tax=Sporolactobacillus putidus TaxID=492735 RepID=A0A917S513_9BACL|nr:hypothetical protein GCM10007968_23920 [Sporolactobacillus putidus]
MKNIQKIPTKRRPICVIIEKIIIRKRGFAKPLARDGALVVGARKANAEQATGNGAYVRPIIL